MSELQALTIKRGHIKGSLTRFATYLNKLPAPLSNTTLEQLKHRLSTVKLLLTQFNEIQEQIELLDSDTNTNELEEFEDLYYSIIASGTVLVNEYTQSHEAETSNFVSNRTESNLVNVKLPMINLPTFNGQYSKWLEFFDTFHSLIHNNESLSGIQKFHYLKSSLKHEASAVIQSLEVSEINYPIAWKTLCERFGNKQLIINNHVKALFQLNAVTKDSRFSLRMLLDDALNHIRALAALGEPTDQWDTLLIYLIASKLDVASRHEWEFYKNTGNKPLFSEFSTFLRTRCDVLETLDIEVGSKRVIKSTFPKIKPNIEKCFVGNTLICAFCNKQHLIYYCAEFLKLAIQDRTIQAKRLKLCINCLRKGHSITECRASTCKTCKQKHNTLLHHNESEKSSATTANIPEPQPSTSFSASNNRNSNDVYQILLSTACVKVCNKRNQSFTCRVLLDSGSQSNFITERMCNLLNLKMHAINSSVRGINQSMLPIRFSTQVKISSLSDEFDQEILCLVLNEITDNLPSVSFDPSNLNIPQDIVLADPKFYNCNTIDMLIGSQLFWKLLIGGHIDLGKNMPTLQETRLGWIISGRIPLASPARSVQTYCNLGSLNEQLVKFWNVEEFSTPPHSAEDQFCEELFTSTTDRNAEGRFIVKIPFTRSFADLGTSNQFAMKRQLSLEKKLSKNFDLAQEYTQFMREYRTMDHMSLVQESERCNQPHFYLPHHAVFKEHSTTTKLRVVFDGSSKSSTGLSLNDLQAAGPPLQQDLISILLRFRCHKFVISADIAKMYRQILIHPSQRNMQQIIWREDTQQPLETYRLNTVTYGTTSAPFLAMRCLKQLATENTIQFPLACTIINNDFYVDDLLTGADSKDELISISKEIDTILKQACFELRKWNSNSEDIKQSISVDNHGDAQSIQLGESSKILGICWIPSKDILQYNINSPNHTQITKRTILSTIAQIYDPLGLVSPVVISVKILIQKLWEAKLDWDEPIPPHLLSIWQTILRELSTLNHLTIPRRVISKSACLLQLHGFCDASNAAYGACVYIRTTNQFNEVATHLICAKSKVAPLKVLSLPRLELSGALLLSNLVEKIRNSIKINFHSCYYWCDSTIALAWIRASPQKWQTFVANRVADIQRTSDIDTWYHIRSHDNPADLVSRGVSPKDLINSTLWWSGLSWLNDPQWSITNINTDSLDTTLLEARKPDTCFTFTTVQDIITHFSSFSKLTRVLAYVKRFVSNCNLPKHERKVESLSIDELNKSVLSILINVQRQCFGNDYKDLENLKNLSKKSNLLSLNPFLDSNGLIRVGGRLTQSNFTYDKRHPVVIPQRHHISDIIARDEHIRLLHCGPQTLLASLRDRYWPISGRNLVRKICRNCVVCFRVKPINNTQLMGNLPTYRTQPSRPFLSCGVDYCGPFFIKDRKTRGAKLIKSYVCLFVCLVTKAMHLELVCDLTTESFLSSLRRFMGRRGISTNIYSDNGSNFIGARNELNEIYNFFSKQGEVIRSALSNERISWHFIPPRSPHFGGLWEAGVKKTKFHIRRVLGTTKFTYEQFYTALVQIEACINSRPLSPLSNDPHDLNPLTPAHFLIGEKLTSIPDCNQSRPSSTLKMFHNIQQLQRHFWERWSKEYISELQQRTRWKTTSADHLVPGSMVVVKEDNIPPLNWQLGRIVEVHPGADELVRVVTVRTVSGLFKRPITKICILPLSES